MLSDIDLSDNKVLHNLLFFFPHVINPSSSLYHTVLYLIAEETTDYMNLVKDLSLYHMPVPRSDKKCDSLLTSSLLFLFVHRKDFRQNTRHFSLPGLSLNNLTVDTAGRMTLWHPGMCPPQSGSVMLSSPVRSFFGI